MADITVGSASDLSNLLGYSSYGAEWDTNNTGLNWNPDTVDGKAAWTNWFNTASPTEVSAWEQRVGTTKDSATSALGMVNGMTDGGETSNTPFGQLISNLQSLIDSNTFDQSSFMDEHKANMTQYSSDIDARTRAIKGANNATMQGNIGANVQGVLNGLASRNMLNSSVASDTMSKTLSDMSAEAMRNNMAAEAQGAEYKLKIPELNMQALQTQAQTSTQMLLPYELLLNALEIDQYTYAQ